VLGGTVEAATVLLPANSPSRQFPAADGWSFITSQRPVLDASSAIQCAGDFGRHFLVLIGETFISNETLGVLLSSFEIDPHFGVSIPRQIDPSTGEIRKGADALGDPELATLPRKVLTAIPEYYIVPELLSSCMLIRDSLICNLPPLDETSETLAGALQLYLCRIRRTGFRTAIVNRAVIPNSSHQRDSVPLPSKSDTLKLHAKYMDAGMAKNTFVKSSFHVFESLLGRLFSTATRLRMTLLLDIRGVRNRINGTAEAIFALCDALMEINTNWNISLLAEPAAVEFHRLHARYSSWPILTAEANQYFTAAVRLSQPWHLETMIELHRMALLNFFTMLDTIGWDIMFESPAELGDFWDFMCQYSDGLLYNSVDTRDHVRRRFLVMDANREYVLHHSFHPRDYASEDGVSSEGGYIFVIVNTYEHKHLNPTIDLLSSAFPAQAFKVLGLTRHRHPKVDSLESGKLPAAEIDQLFRGAKLIVFPSFYEGFGFPVLKGLSYGRTVLARRSPLLREIASHYRGPGKLLDFLSPVELVEAVGRIIHGLPLEELSLGTALSDSEEPKTWHDVAHGLLRFIEGQMADPSKLQWHAREQAIRQMIAFST
jgi:Glycosyl transferases group 1